MTESVFTELRREYSGPTLDRDSIVDCPIEQFRLWFDEAVAAEIPMANGMTLATCGADGMPSARIVLLKSFDQSGFVFYSNYNSEKGAEVDANPRASLLFWWQALHRQIRITGAVERTSAAESDAYFATRPRASNLSAMASPQSQPIADRQWLAERVRTLQSEIGDSTLVRPDNWGGYRVVPQTIEFWQGHGDRLHDRLRYRRNSDTWTIERLAP